METKLGKLGDLKVVKKTPTGFVLENGTEIEDTFAEMFHHTATADSVLEKSPLFWSLKPS